MWESSGELIEYLIRSKKVHVNLWSIFLSFQVTGIICGVHSTGHFTIQVVHLVCFVLIKFNLKLTILSSYTETSTEGAQNGYHELLITASLTVSLFPIFQASAVSADIFALFADEEFPRYE